jgi:hypothetical protein
VRQPSPAPFSRPANRPAAQAQPPAPQPAQVYISAYARDFSPAPAQAGESAAFPLAQQRASGGFSLREGVATVPSDGYYMLLWELGVDEAQGGAQLHLGINGNSAQLTHGLQPGHDSAQQVTWLSKGDRVRLFLKGGGTVQCGSAMLTIIRLG